jgi:arsenate reductase
MMKPQMKKQKCISRDILKPAQQKQILIICMGNSIRSIMAEAILNHLGDGRVTAYSAGIHPVGEINTHVEALLTQKGYDIEKQYSKSWMEFAHGDGQKIDFIISLCPSADQFIMQNWKGCPKRIYWAFPDISGVSFKDKLITSVFEDMYYRLYHALARPLDLPLEDMTVSAICEAMSVMQAGRGVERLS